ncbi:MAG: RNA polymerase sigma factor [Defluviitaleaceae bacterium]|nr:RNA polymerase sigma factor [Defluviitaleaceae bacterium]
MASVEKEFSDFLEAHEKDIFSFCLYLTMRGDDAEELYQDTMLAAFLSMDKLDMAKNPKAFIYAIAAGKWKNARRKAFRRNTIAPAADVLEIADMPGADGTEAAIEKVLFKKAIAEAFSRLDVKYRVPLILCYFDDCSIEVIAGICKIPKGTVKSRLHKGRSLLKRELVKEGYDGR